jgi:quaternary ammonium compound-resistance protein SugE
VVWPYLLVAALFEVQWAVTLKHTQGFTRLRPSLACVLGMTLSV